MPQRKNGSMDKNTSAVKQYNHTLDFVRGILIILVVIGHVIRNSVPRYIIYSFHMPLFLFLLGYLIRNEAGKGYLVKKAKRLLIPFATASAFYFVWWSFFTPGVNVLRLLASMVLAPPHHMWFLYSAFFHYLFIYAAILLQQKRKSNIWPAVTCVAILLFILSKWIQPYTFFEAKRTFGFFLFTLAGFLYRHNLLPALKRTKDLFKSNPLHGAIPFSLFLFFITAQYVLDSSVAGFPLLAVTYSFPSYLLFGLANLALGLFVARMFEQHTAFYLPLTNNIGENSLVVYLYHFIVFQIAILYLKTQFAIILLSIIIPLALNALLKKYRWYRLVVLGDAEHSL